MFPNDCMAMSSEGPIFYRQLELEKATALKRHAGDFDAHMTVSRSAKADLLWWMDNVLRSKRRAHLAIGVENVATQPKVVEHINCELHYMACRVFVQISETNMFTYKLITWQKRVALGPNLAIVLQPCNSIAKEIWQFAQDRNVWLSAHVTHYRCGQCASIHRVVCLQWSDWMDVGSNGVSRSDKTLGKPVVDMFHHDLTLTASSVWHGSQILKQWI